MRGQGHGSLITITIRCWWDALSVVSLSSTTTHTIGKYPFVSFTFFFLLVYTLLRGHAEDCAETVIMPIDDCVS